MLRIAAAINKAVHSDKMNYKALGNGAPHLHWYVLPHYNID